MKKIIDLAIEALILSLLVFSPLAFGSVHIWAYSLMELTVYSALILWAIKKMLYGRPVIEKELVPVYISIALFILIAAFQLVPLSPEAVGRLSPKAHELYVLLVPGYGTEPRGLSVYPHATLSALLKFVSYAVFFFLVTQEFGDRRKIRRAVFVLALVGFCEALYGLYGYFGRDYYIFGFKKTTGLASATGTYLNRNHFSGYLGVVSMLSLGYLLGLLEKRDRGYGLRHRLTDFISSRRGAEGGALLTLILTMALGVAFSMSRMGIIAFIVSILAVFITTSIGRQKRLSAALFAILTIAVAGAVYYGAGPIEERYRDISTSEARDGRLAVWGKTVGIIKDFPLTGTGAGTFEQAFQLYKGREHSQVIYTHAHNDYLELASDFGIAGALILLSGFAYFFALMLRRSRFFSTTPRQEYAFQRGMGLGGAGAIVYMTVHSLTDFNMHIPANALTFSAVIGLAYCGVSESRGGIPAEKNRPAIIGIPALLAVVFLAIYAGSFALERWKSERAYPVERDFTRGYGTAGVPGEKDIEGLVRAASLSPDNYKYRLQLGKHYAYSAPAKDPKRRTDYLRKAEEEYQRAAFLNPFYTESLAYLSWVEFSLGKYADAASLLETAVKADPYNYFNHIYYGITVSTFIDRAPDSLRELYIYRAEEEFKRGLELNPSMENQPAVFTARAELYAKKGDAASAIAQLERLDKASASNIRHHLRLAGLYMASGRENMGIEKYGKLLESREIGDAGRKILLDSLRKDSALHPSEPTLKLLLGRAYIEAKEWQKAIGAFEDYSHLRPSDADAHYLIGEAYDALGQKDKAYDAYMRALRISRAHPGASRRLLEFHRVR